MIVGPTERGLWIADPDQRRDLGVFAHRARVLDESAVVRLRVRGDGLLGAWVVTGFDVLAARVVTGTMRPSDLTCAADALLNGLRAADSAGGVDPGFPMDSAWRGALPAETGFVHLDDVPATVAEDLARRGAELSRELNAPGPPAALLDQEVLTVSADAGSVGVPMRCFLALAAMRFLPDNPDDAEVVRVRVAPAWLRLDARYGSVFRRRGSSALLIG